MWYDVDYRVAHVMVQCELGGEYSTTQRNMEKAERCPTNGGWSGMSVTLSTEYSLEVHCTGLSVTRMVHCVVQIAGD